ncbi:MAG: TolC family protein [Gammaproteobacteria bacterium]|nr:TolC family protein [Gammaproteobacteria bacterium]MBU6508728.1 TolC family protein [Gammaproteobacteria bacterium]MDE1983034.1 TolC family protein [Gammaproteobacteria bacterium]MDE2107619.1 TolC family protein [Gammaproteobacteria bacterium]
MRRGVGARWAAVALTALAVLAVPPANAADDTSIGFQQAVERALAANPRALASRADVEAAKAGADAALGQALPSLALQLSAARSNNPLDVFGYRLAERQATFADFGLAQYAGPASLTTAPLALNQPGYANNYDTGVVLRVPLFAGGRNAANLRATRALAQAAQAGDAAARAALTYEVLQAYAGVQAAAALVSAAHQSLDAAEADLKTAESLFRQGLVIQSDVLLARARRESAQAALATAEAGARDQLESFRTLLGAPASDLVPGAPVAVSLPQGTLADLEGRALDANPQLQALAAQAAAGQAARGAASAGNWPQFDLILRHDWNADSLALRAPSNTVMATVSWQLFSSGAQSAEVRRAAAEANAAAERYRGAADDTRLAVARAWRAAESAATTAQASVLAAEQTDEAARLLALRYAQGLATLAQLQDSEARRDAERAQSVESAYRALLARAQVRLLLNQLDPAAFNVVPTSASEPGS